MRLPIGIEEQPEAGSDVVKLPRVSYVALRRSTLNAMLNAFDRSDDETHVFGFGKYMPKANCSTITDLSLPSDDDYLCRSPGHLELKPEAVARIFAEFRKQGKTLVFCGHSHPHGFSKLSPRDVKDTCNGNYHFFPHLVFGVYDRQRLTCFKASSYNCADFKIVGALDEVDLRVVEDATLRRFDRHIRFMGLTGQLLISSAKVLLIGCGGGNTIIAFALASMGCHSLTICDPDIWEEHNRNRVWIPSKHVGRSKANSVKALINTYHPEIRVKAFSRRAEELPSSVYDAADIIIVGSDGESGRVYTNRRAIEFAKPAIFPAAGIYVANDNKLSALGGSVQVVKPFDSPCFECINKIDADKIVAETLSPTEKQHLKEKYKLGNGILDVPIAPSVISLNYVIAGAAIWEFLKIVTGLREAIPFQTYDGLTGSLSEIHVTRRAECPACGDFDPDGQRNSIIPESLQQFLPSHGPPHFSERARFGREQRF